MASEAENLIAVVSTTKVRDMLTQPPYAAVFSSSDAAIVQGRAPKPVFRSVKPTRPVTDGRP